MSFEQNKIISRNKKASFEYFLEDKYEAGIVLVGSELKSLRAGKINIADSFIEERNNELYLLNMHIAEYKGANQFNHAPLRPRKILLRRKEINKLIGRIKTKGVTIIPTLVYFNAKNKVKLEIAVALGKKLHDKRESIKERDWNTQKQRLLKDNNR